MQRSPLERGLASGQPSDNKVSGERKKKSLLGFERGELPDRVCWALGEGSNQTVVKVDEEMVFC